MEESFEAANKIFNHLTKDSESKLKMFEKTKEVKEMLKKYQDGGEDDDQYMINTLDEMEGLMIDDEEDKEDNQEMDNVMDEMEGLMNEDDGEGEENKEEIDNAMEEMEGLMISDEEEEEGEEEIQK